jgi:hypothetical protein
MTIVNFQDQLRRQLGFLRNSARLFDDGVLDEAIRMATSLRILFHQTGSSTSLLTHLGAHSCNLRSSISVTPGVQEVFPLVIPSFVANLDPRLKALPRLDSLENDRFIPYVEWWSQEPIIGCGEHNLAKATRRDLVLWAANKDGGAHVDAQLDPAYQRAIEGVGFSIQLVAGASPIPPERQKAAPLENLPLASLRQITYEVLNSPELGRLCECIEISAAK